MSASAVQAHARQRPGKAPNQSKNPPKFGESALLVSSGELLTFNSRQGGGYADLPLRPIPIRPPQSRQSYAEAP